MPDTLRDELQTALADRYLIERELGRGGMATVYLARDLKHQRHVALKLLNPDLGAVLGAERFLSEIRVTANLQHPNLLPLFDSGEANGLLYYVMPFVEGESLRALLDREKQLPIDEAVRIAVAIANALEYAHGHGVIHRDLKPENILIQHDQPVVADFGIALAVSNAGGQRVTQTGLSLGTPQYMSPEQATGDRTIDRRADIYSLGAITYEMLSGEPPHTGATAQAIIARLMTEDPRSLSATRRNVPAYVDAAVHRALEKLPADRFGSAREFSDALQGRVPVTAAASRGRSATAPAGATRNLPLIGIAAALGVASLVFGAAWWRASHRASPPPLRFTLDLPEGVHVDNTSAGSPIAVSPDGQAIAFFAGTPRHVFIRRLDQLAATAFPKLLNPSDIHFSGDGRAVAYMASGIRQAPIGYADTGVEPTLVAALTGWNGSAWGPGHDIIWVMRDSLWRASPSGGKPVLIAAAASDSVLWSNVAALPGKMIAFRFTPPGVVSGTAADRLGLIPAGGGEPIIVDLSFQNVIGFADGVLVFGQAGGRISAVRLDVRTGGMRGEPVTVVDNPSFKAAGGVAASMGDDGTLAYILGSTQALQQIVDDKGAVVGVLPEQKNFVSPSWSPDGLHIAMGVAGTNGYGLWLYDLRSRLLTQLGPNGYRTAWTPDGKRIAFVEDGIATPAMWMPADGSSAPVAIPGTEGLRVRQIAFSPDAKYVVVSTSTSARDSAGGAHAFAIPLAGGTRIPLMPEVRSPVEPAISPNGKWISYTSTETGEPHVIVRAFPTGTGRVQISSDRGWEAKWSRDGTRLFYRDGRSVRAATLDIGGAMPRVVRVDSLFADLWVSNAGAFSWDVFPDGKRFVMRRESGDARIIVEKNWLPRIKAKLDGR